MTTETQQKQRQSVNAGMVVATKPFVPSSDFAELEAARVAHETAIEEHLSVAARRQEAAAEERQLQEHLKTVQEAKRAARDEASKEVKQATIAALQVVAEHGEAWMEKIAAERAAALEEHDELLARAAEVNQRAHKHDALEAWLKQAASESVPQSFADVASRVAS